MTRHLPVRSVADFGAGQGAWLSVWQRLGVSDITALDGAYVDQDALLVPKHTFVPSDLSRPVRLGRTFDLVQSLEVAEHLPASAAEQFVDNLVAHSAVVLFSAATLGQGGEHHVNERPYSYWRDLFSDRGYLMFDLIRPFVIENGAVKPWVQIQHIHLHRSRSHGESASRHSILSDRSRRANSGPGTATGTGSGEWPFGCCRSGLPPVWQCSKAAVRDVSHGSTCVASLMTRDVLSLTIRGRNGESAPGLHSLRRLTAKALRAATPVLVVAATGLYLWLFLRVQWRIGDEGSIVYGAARVTEGALPYRDFFEVMGPGTFYWLALWFKALGTSWLISRVAVLTTALVSACAIYYATTRKDRGQTGHCSGRPVHNCHVTLMARRESSLRQQHVGAPGVRCLRLCSATHPERLSVDRRARRSRFDDHAAKRRVSRGSPLRLRIDRSRQSRGWKRTVADAVWIVDPFYRWALR